MNLLEPDCNCNVGMIKYSNFKGLIESNIEKLRKGVPEESYTFHPNRYGISKELQFLKEIGRRCYIGYDDDYFDFCPINVWDLEKLYLIGLNFWSILYSVDFGLFSGISQVRTPYSPPYYISLYRESFQYSYSLFTGYHERSNKEVLVLSRDEKVDINGLSNLKKIENVKKDESDIDISNYISRTSLLYNDINTAEWYLYFSLGEDTVIVPQEKSKLDIRSFEELEHLMEINDMLSDYTKKRYLLDWDKSEAFS